VIVEPLADQYAHPADVAQDVLDQHQAQKTAPLPKKLHRGRPGFVVLTVLLVEIVLVAAVGNQAVSKHLQDYLSGHPGLADYTRGAVQAALTFHWRFTPQHGEVNHLWAAQLAAIATLLVLTGLLSWVVSRGSVTFSRIWVSVAAVVAVLTPVAVMVGNVIVVPNAPGPGLSRVGQAIYGYPSFGPVIVAGIVLGALAGLFAALFAIITRRAVSLAAVTSGAPSDAPLNAYGVPTPGYEPPPWPAQAESAPTAYIPAYEELPANRGPLDHLPQPAALPAAEVPVPPPSEEQPSVTTAESAAIDAPTQSMHIEMTQPEIVMAEDGVVDDPERTQPPTPVDVLEDTQPPGPPQSQRHDSEPIPIEDDPDVETEELPGRHDGD
jgi:hypothetical protein